MTFVDDYHDLYEMVARRELTAEEAVDVMELDAKLQWLAQPVWVRGLWRLASIILEIFD